MRNTRCLKPFGLLFLLCLLPVWALAQTITVKGVVKDPTGQTAERYVERNDYRF